MAGLMRNLILAIGVAGWLTASAGEATSLKPVNTDEEAAYVRGALAGTTSRMAAQNDAFLMLRMFQTGTDVLRRACASAYPDLASTIAEEWTKSRLGSAAFMVNRHLAPADTLLRDQLEKQLASIDQIKSLPECQFFAAYLNGIEEALPPSVQVLLDIPTDRSPYAASSHSPVLRVLIGHAGPTSGVIAHLGLDNENGARLAIEELNAQQLKIQGKPVRFMLMPVDDQADARRGEVVARKLVEAQVKAVVGHLNSGVSVPASRIYRDAGIPMISPSSTNPWLTRQGFRSVFRVLLDDEKLGQGLARYTKEALGARRIAVIRDGTTYGDGIALAFDAELHQLGIEVTNREVTSNKATEFTDVLRRIKANNPDLVFFGGMDAVAGPLLRQMKAMDIAAKLMGGDGICSSGLAELAGDALRSDQVFCAEAGGVDKAHERAMSAFKTRFKSRFAKDVEVYAPYAYDATKLVANAMVQAQTVEPAEYLPRLKATRDFQGVTGPYSFDQRGDPIEGQFTVYTYRNGKRVEVSVRRFVQPAKTVTGAGI